MNTQNPQDDRFSYEELELRLRRAEAENKRLTQLLSARDRQVQSMKLNMDTQRALSRTMETGKRALEWYTALMLEHCPDVIFILDREKRFVLCTRAFLTLFGVDGEEVAQGRPFGRVAARFLPAALGRTLLEHVERSVTQTDYVRRFSASAGGRQFECFVQSLEETGGSDEYELTGGTLVLLHDATDLTRAKDEAELANRAKTDFLATMSHEIRTPMNAIIGLQDTIMQEPLTMRQRNYFFNMKSASKALMDIINDILDFSKIEAGKMTVENESFDLYALLDSLSAQTRMLCEKKSLVFETEREKDLPRYMCSDEKKVRQILGNLLSNAVKYTPTGSVTLTAQLEDGYVKLTVRDTGIGIREEDRKKLFSPFEQLDQRKNKSVIGTGLGLAITGRLCGVLGGGIEVESVYGLGSAFIARLPFMEGVAAGEADCAEDTLFAPEAKVLVVDDVDINLLVAEALLEMFGIKPDLASGGHEALRLTAQRQYDLIFMDQMMPDLDGMETTLLLRNQGGHNARVPVVALTANVMTVSPQILREAGLNDCLSKPVESRQMCGCLKKWLPSELIV